MSGIPVWLHWLAIASLSIAVVCALVIAADLLLGHKQHMWIMDVVWPVTALYSSVLGLYSYFKVGRLSEERRVQAAKERHEDPPNKKKPFWESAAVGATHCGSGCTLGDICAEMLVFTLGLTLFGFSIFAAWSVDFALAYLFGIAFQYFTIKPMRELSVKEGLVQAIKADTLSLTAWQLGMYGFMAIAHFVLFKSLLGVDLKPNMPEFWFMMQIAMLFGFLTSYPVNWWLIRRGTKEAM